MLTEVLLALLLLSFWIIYPKKPKGLPPGKWGWPIIGSLPTPSLSFVEEVKQLRIEYGDVVSWRIGRKIHIFLFNYKTIKSVLSKLETADRPNFFSFQSTSLLKQRGIFSTSGTVWSKNRRFTIHHLKDFGLGKSWLGDAIQQEAANLVEYFKKCTESPQKLPWSIHVATVNIIWKMVADKRYKMDDQEIIVFNKMTTDLVLALDGPAKWLDLFDWLDPFIPRKIKERLGVMEIYNISKTITDYFMETIEYHQKTLDPEKPRDFIDAYLIEMADPKSDLIEANSIENLKITILNLFVAGSDTTASTIRWALFYMAKYPDIQTKVQKEIDAVVPRDTVPSLEHRAQMPYTEAMINEVNRLVSLTPLAVPHSVNKEIEIDGYRIPKDCVLMPHIQYCHTNPEHWEKPRDFYPEHFLDEDGQVTSKREGFLPFSIGRRVCLGESMACMELFIFLSSLLQKFRFTRADTNDLSADNRRQSERFSNMPKDIAFIITERE